ncbi:MAG: transketolase [Patescibacteria group bacterium]
MQHTHTQQLEQTAKDLRLMVTEMLYASGSGHWGSSLGTADIFSVLFFGGVLRHSRLHAKRAQMDRFILSCGHICPIYYACLIKAGYLGDKKVTLRKLGSPLQGHPSHSFWDAIETSTGPLGQGVGVAVGKALALRLTKSKSRVFCMTSDGEHEEGSTWEAVAAAGKHALSSLVFILDRNHMQISGTTEEVSNLGDIATRYETLGWRVLMVDGNSVSRLLTVFEKAQTRSSKPTLVLCTTVMGKGVPFIENNYHYHGKAPNNDEYTRALSFLK